MQDGQNETAPAFVLQTLRAALRPVPLLVWALGTLLAVLTGPFGTFDKMGLGLRVLYWVPVTGSGMVFGYLGWALARLLLRPGPNWLADGLTAVLAAAMLSPAIWLLRGMLDPVWTHSDLRIAQIMLNSFGVYIAVLILCQLVGRSPAQPRAARTAESRKPPEAPPQPRLARRLSDEVRGEILRLSGRDHHVEVITRNGCETLRLRLSDAIEEMEPVKGICTHRSHWVALAAVATVERESGGKLFLRLTNGERVPVSRTYRPRVEAAGLFD